MFPFSSLPWDQDFYSHSNWVELGKQQPHPHLLWPRQELGNLAQGTAVTPVVGGCSQSHLFSAHPATISQPEAIECDITSSLERPVRSPSLTKGQVRSVASLRSHRKGLPGLGLQTSVEFSFTWLLPPVDLTIPSAFQLNNDPEAAFCPSSLPVHSSQGVQSPQDWSPRFWLS